MTDDTLTRLLENGENYYIEFKQEYISNNELTKEAVAFANAEGGNIFFGINDFGDIVGVPLEPGKEEQILNVLRNNCYPAIYGDIKWLSIDDKYILQLEIRKGKFKPYSTKDGDFYIRVGNTKRKASKEELTRLLQSGGYFQFNNLIIEHSTIEDLEKSKIADYFKNIYKIDIYNTNEVEKLETLLVNSKIMGMKNQQPHPTVAGMLTFGVRPQDFLFQSGIIFSRIRGTEIFGDILDVKHLEGRLPDLIEQCLTIFRLYNTRRSVFIDGKRIDREEYLEDVFRELMVNAVCHRNYSITGSRIRVLFFDDRYEIRSPGRLPNTITIENIKTGITFIRNQLLFKFLNHYGYIENLGRGIPMSIRKNREFNGKEPIFTEEGEEFVVKVLK